MDEIIKLRHTLHQNPELSGSEGRTAQRIAQFFSSLQPDRIIENIGGTGVAVMFFGEDAGPTVLLRCELDALPIEELNQVSHKSTCHGVAHQCGHDGHMAILAAVGKALSNQRLKRGRVILLYQPAEETGAGAEAIVNDPLFAEIKPDFAFALHNVPGFPLGQVVVRNGVFSSASRGVTIRLSGTTAHAAQPETGLSPAKAMCSIIQQFSQLPSYLAAPDEVAFATVVGSRLGEKAFGTAPGVAEIWTTLRCETDASMVNLVEYVERVVEQSANEERLQAELSYQDIFSATVNSSQAVDIVQRAVAEADLNIIDRPFRWSEDFGRITAQSQGALFGLGAGIDTPDLHNPDYDFPDELISVGASIFLQIIQGCLSMDS